MFVVKRYDSLVGVSNKMHTDQDMQFEVKGPMGKNLEV
jgi:hypothetical protein